MKRLLAFLGWLLGLPPRASEPGPVNCDLDIDVSIDPPSGSTLRATEPIHVTVRYRYASPRQPLQLFVKPIDEEPDYTYQGSIDHMEPGEGEIRRFVFLNVPGHIRGFKIYARQFDLREVWRRDIPVDFTFEDDAELQARRSDGAGSRIVSVAFDPPSPGTVRVNEAIRVVIDYDVVTPNGLRPWAEPLVDGPRSFDGLDQSVTGRGTVVKHIVVGQPGRLDRVRVGLSNDASATVVQQDVDVQFVVHP